MKGLQEMNNTTRVADADSKIQKLFDEIEVYRQAIRDAEDALASAEMELDDELDARCREMTEGGNADV